MKFHSEDNGECRVYYRGEKRALYCFQNEGSWGRVDFKFYACSKDGEPSHQVTPPANIPRPPGDEAIGRELIAWLNATKAEGAS